MKTSSSHPSTASGLDAIARRYCFAAWPQAFAHASWFDVLDGAVGLTVSRETGRTVVGAEQAVAHALLKQVSVDFSQRVADEYVPLWAMQAHAPMRQHLSTIAAFALLPTLKLAISGVQAQHWDSVLGTGVRRAALLLARTHPNAEPPLHATGLRQHATVAAKTAVAWEAFTYRLGLAALKDQNAAVRARFRLIWPHAMRDEEPLELEDSVQFWLVDACLLSTQVQRNDPSVRRLAE